MNKMDDPRQMLKTFSLAAFLNDIGHYMIMPIWPVFITGVLGAPASFLGMIDGVGEAMSSLFQYPAGRLADKHSRKQFILVGYFLPVLSRIGFALTSIAFWVLPLNVIDRTGKSIRDPARDAMLANSVQKEQRGKMFGFLEGWDHLGATIGPLITFALLALLGYRDLILLAAIPSALGVFLISRNIKEKKVNTYSSESFEIKKMSLAFKNVIKVSCIFGFAWFSISFATLFSITVLGYSIASMALAIFIYALFSAIGSFMGGKLSDTSSRKYVLGSSMALFGLSCEGFIYASANNIPGLVFGLFALNGLHYGMITPVQKAYVADLNPANLRSSAQGLYDAIFGVTAMCASMIAGVLWMVAGPVSIFYYGVIITLVAVIALNFLVTNNDR